MCTLFDDWVFFVLFILLLKQSSIEHCLIIYREINKDLRKVFFLNNVETQMRCYILFD